MKKTVATVLILIAILCAVIISEETLMPIDTPEETGFSSSLYQKNKDKGIKMEVFSDNSDYEYARISMETLHYRSVDFDFGIQIPYITAETQTITWGDPYCTRITSVEELNVLISLIEGRRGADLPEDDPYGLVLKHNSIAGPVDEAFFREYHIYTVEIGFEGSTYSRSRVDSITTENGQVTIDISYQTNHAATAGYPAELLFIVIPADAETVNVSLKETAWENPK